MRLLIDTNRYSDLARRLPEATHVVSQAASVLVPFIVLAELHSGFRKGGKRSENEKQLQKFLSQPGVDVLYPDAGTVDLFADLDVSLQRQGTPIPDHDIWIAALALQHDLTLYARDKHFDHLPQLSRV